MVMAAFSAAAIVGVPVGLALANWLDWTTPFIALGALGAIVLILVLMAVPSIRGHIKAGVSRPNPFLSFRHAFTRANQLKALGLVFFLVLGQFTVIPFIAPYMEANVGFSKSAVVWVYFIGGFATAISAPLIGQLADPPMKYTHTTAL